MRIPLTLSLYIGRQFLIGILLALVALSSIIWLIDLVELIRRSSGREDVGLGLVFQMSLLKLPNMMEMVLPFAALIGGMITLLRLTRSHELVVTRASGVSVWQFLLPAVVIALLLGAFSTAVFNPLSATMALRYERLDAKYLRGRPNLLTVSDSGLWLRQIEEDGQQFREHLIHAQRVIQADMSLDRVIVFSFSPEYHFARRIDAQTATLVPGSWWFHNATLSMPGKPPEKYENFELKTTLTLAQIQDSFATPRTMSFWHLPGFIHMLEMAGFSALNHRLHFHSLLAVPFLLCAMILLAALFSLRLPRFGGTALMIVAGLLAGFIVRFLSDIVGALGLSGSLPVALAAWAPALVATLIATAFLLHFEDG